MGWIGEINTLEELEALMCGNVLPAAKYPNAFYRLRKGTVKRLIMYATEIVLMNGGELYV